MGFFSWKTSDTDRSICNRYSSRETFPVYVLCPGGGCIEETDYDGYGHFGGRDIYALVARWNYPLHCMDENGCPLPDEQVRNLGIRIACTDKRNAGLRYPIKIVEDPTLNYWDVKPSVTYEYQGYFYDGWLGDYEDED